MSDYFSHQPLSKFLILEYEAAAIQNVSLSITYHVSSCTRPVSDV